MTRWPDIYKMWFMTSRCYLVFVCTVSDHNEILDLCWIQGLYNHRCINKQDGSLFKQCDKKDQACEMCAKKRRKTSTLIKKISFRYWHLKLKAYIYCIFLTMSSCFMLPNVQKIEALKSDVALGALLEMATHSASFWNAASHMTLWSYQFWPVV